MPRRLPMEAPAGKPFKDIYRPVTINNWRLLMAKKKKAKAAKKKKK